MYKRYLKRLFDIINSLTLIIGLSWLFIILILLIKMTSKGNVFYKQKRIGKNKEEFYILKFRTMKITAPGDVPTHLLKNPEQYITGVGKILRKTSLDELPQLLNILIGDMSFIGPRPALWNQFDLISERDVYNANSIRPGLTGWAQVNGRDELPIRTKAKYDGEYIHNITFIFDFLCILKTFKCVFKCDNIREGIIEVEGTGNYEKGANNWS